ncbi:uncharacterized protein LOC118880934 [Balaenoptera musculus]|uniref:Uncharacterized protein LOC118880934 n=1 Tax=Balaenoptera musculus TaxID=9771 RepID=A0A8B8V869_BALMU|nr:uncharacterized protein LOC118880934 [Balaenoptera musculus]
MAKAQAQDHPPSPGPPPIPTPRRAPKSPPTCAPALPARHRDPPHSDPGCESRKRPESPPGAGSPQPLLRAGPLPPALPRLLLQVPSPRGPHPSTSTPAHPIWRRRILAKCLHVKVLASRLDAPSPPCWLLALQFSKCGRCHEPRENSRAPPAGATRRRHHGSHLAGGHTPTAAAASIYSYSRSFSVGYLYLQSIPESKDVQLARRDHVGLAVHVRWNVPPWPDVLCFPHGPPHCTWLLSSHGAAGMAADLNLRFDVSQLILVSVATCEQRLLCWVVGEREDGERSRRSWAHRESSLGKGWACRSEVRGGLRRGWTGAQRTSEVRRLNVWGGAPRQRALGGQRAGGRADGPTVGLGRGVLLRWECCSGGNAAGGRVEPRAPGHQG